MVFSLKPTSTITGEHVEPITLGSLGDERDDQKHCASIMSCTSGLARESLEIQGFSHLPPGRESLSREGSSYGIDTLKVGYKITPSDVDLKGWKHTSHADVKESDEEVYADVYRKRFTAPNGTEIQLKLVPTNYKHNPFNMLFIEFSLPKLVMGCNHLDVDDWNAAVRIANMVIASIPGLPHLPDIREATLYRIDLCANLHVGKEDVSDYIQALHKANYPHRTTKPYGKNGVIFTSSKISTCIYDKHRECNCDGARGILRYEISMRTRWKISGWTGKTETTLRDVTPEMARDAIEKDMRILHLDKHMVCDRLNAEAILSQKYLPSRVRTLLGYMAIRSTSTVEQMKQQGYKSHSIRYYDKLLAEAGVSSLSIESKKTLPALTLLLEDIKSEKNCHKVPSDTRVSKSQGGCPKDSLRIEAFSNQKLTTQLQGWNEGRSGNRPRAP